MAPKKGVKTISGVRAQSRQEVERAARKGKFKKQTSDPITLTS